MKTTHSKKLFYILIIGSIFLLIYSVLVYKNFAFAETNKLASINTNKETTESVKTNIQNNEVIKEKLIAKSYIIYDINNKKIVRSENAETILPLASLTKIITVGTLLDKAEKNKINLREETKLIIKKALVSSSNSDADALGYIYSYSFGGDLVTASNEFLNTSGISDIQIRNLTGLDNYDGVNLSASNVGSAQSVAKTFAFLYENYREIFEYTMFNQVETEVGTLQNTNHGTEKTFGIMASKTGFTFEAGGNLGVVVSPEPGSAYVVLVMGSTKEGRFKDIEKLVKLLPYIIN